MSLIGDALRKARQEAADRESDRKGILYSAKIADSPSRSSLGLGLALGALIAVFATVAGGAAVWWILDSAPSPAPSPASESASETDPVLEDSDSDSQQRQQPAAVTGTATAAGTATEPANESVVEPDPVLGDRDSGGQQRQQPAAVTGTATAAGTATEPVSDQASRPRPKAPDTSHATDTGFIGTEDGEEIYILEADLGDVNLSLDFLIYREVDPFAEINGVELHLGGTIEGFRVKDIERNLVRLSNGRRTIVLRAP